MQGLALSRAFYAACRPVLWAAIPDIMERAAVGLVGEGSECFGCDDATSRDHDFGPAFCVWLPRAELVVALPRLENALALLPRQFAGYESRLLPERRMGRVGPVAVEDFYKFFTGVEHFPHTVGQWLAIPEYHLAACTNGEVFEDTVGLFTAWRKALLPCYPQDVRLKKIAARCMTMAQTGQYNVPRCLGRGDTLAAMLALARFAEAALSLVFLCNARYTPFYKWAGRQAAGLPVLGAEVTRLLTVLAAPFSGGSAPLAGSAAAPLAGPFASPLAGPLAAPFSAGPLVGTAMQAQGVTIVIEELCAAVAAHLRASGLSNATGDWLWAHGPQILRLVQNDALRSMDMLQG